MATIGKKTQPKLSALEFPVKYEMSWTLFPFSPPRKDKSPVPAGYAAAFILYHEICPYLPLTTKQVTRKTRRTMPPATDTARRVGWLGSPIAKTSDGGRKKKNEA